jgi:hypothetical protein
MPIIDKALDVVAPQASDEELLEATRKARWAATPGDWLSLALDHHDVIRRAFDACRGAVGAPARLAAMRRLASVLNGHAIAEELVLYPALAQAGDKLAAGQAYVAQVAPKMQMAELERIDPAGEDWLARLEDIRRAVLFHMYEEEGGWFLALKDKAEDQTYLANRYQQEFARYVAEHEPLHPPVEPRSFEPTQPTTSQLDCH